MWDWVCPLLSSQCISGGWIGSGGFTGNAGVVDDGLAYHTTAPEPRLCAPLGWLSVSKDPEPTLQRLLWLEKGLGDRCPVVENVF